MLSIEIHTNAAVREEKAAKIAKAMQDFLYWRDTHRAVYGNVFKSIITLYNDEGENLVRDTLVFDTKACARKVMEDMIRVDGVTGGRYFFMWRRDTDVVEYLEFVG